MQNKEYLKLYWKHNEKDEPVVILYEVDLDEKRYATRLIDIYADRHTENNEDKEWGFITEASVPTVEEFNSNEYGEEFNAKLIKKEHFEKVWNSEFYEDSLYCQNV